jgi:hypothetical protein
LGRPGRPIGWSSGRQSHAIQRPLIIWLIGFILNTIFGLGSRDASNKQYYINDKLFRLLQIFDWTNGGGYPVLWRKIGFFQWFM